MAEEVSKMYKFYEYKEHIDVDIPCKILKPSHRLFQGSRVALQRNER